MYNGPNLYKLFLMYSGPKLDKLGMRGSNTSELIFEDCRYFYSFNLTEKKH